MRANRRGKLGRILAFNKDFEVDSELLEALRKENERREIERKMQEEENRRIMYVDPLDQRFSL